MADGDYDARVTTGSDILELQTLSTTFNTMADEVKSARQVQRDFLANVSHDLRTPLTSIQGFSQAMMDGTVPAEQQTRVATIIYTEAGRLSRLVLDLLDLARIEAGRFAMNRRDVNLKEVLTQVHETLTPQAERAGVALDMKLPSRALPLFADSDRLAQVFSNLLDNAVTYAQQGGKNVKISASLGGVRNLRNYTPGATYQSGARGAAGQDGMNGSNALDPGKSVLKQPVLSPAALAEKNGGEPGNQYAPGARATTPEEGADAETKLGRWWVEVKITDDGPGIGLDQKARVFERFHRGDTARGGGGMGLGLAIAKEIVEAHGGDIGVQDNEPQGTAVTVRLPMKMW
jgi:signal transduction histidine kinase